MSFKNGDSIDNIFKKEELPKTKLEKLHKTKLEKLHNNLSKVNLSDMKDISMYSKMLIENKKDNLVKIIPVYL